MFKPHSLNALITAFFLSISGPGRFLTIAKLLFLYKPTWSLSRILPIKFNIHIKIFVSFFFYPWHLFSKQCFSWLHDVFLWYIDYGFWKFYSFAHHSTCNGCIKTLNIKLHEWSLGLNGDLVIPFENCQCTFSLIHCYWWNYFFIDSI